MLDDGTQAMDAALQHALETKTCDFCGNVFNRREHLIRHRRTHTKEKPFSCSVCRARFLRPDVKDKHEKRCYEVNSKAGRQGTDELISVRHNSRSRLACDSCRRKKLKCDNGTPCRTCLVRKIPCTVSSSSRRPGRPRHDEVLSLEASQPGQSGPYPENSSSLGNGLDTAQSVEQGAEGIYSISVEAGMTDPPPLFFQHDFTLQPDPLTGFDHFGSDLQSLDFIGGLWSLDLLAFDGSVDDSNLSFFDESWLQLPGSVLDQAPDRALDMMREHFRFRSRAPSPSRLDTGREKYSIAPDLAKYDSEIINVFLNLARLHLSESLPIFASYEAGPGTRVELCLAMASIGALYSEVPGSMKIARSLYHDARRLLLETYLTSEAMSEDRALSHTMTFILLELYGLCSGNKRAYEFSEVWHGSLLDTAGQSLANPSVDITLVQSMQKSLQTLESYRVLILGLPPSITKVTDSCDEAALNEAMSPSNLTIQQTSPDIADLIMMAGIVGSSIKETSKQLWKSEFIELALDRWIRLQQHDIKQAEMVLFNMVNIYLHSNIPLLQRYATVRAASRSALDIPDELRAWISSHNYRISRWHAEKILAAIKQITVEDASVSRVRPTKVAQPPHLAYCLYFALIIIWCDGNTGADKLVSDGLQILSSLKVHVAKLLTMALREILPESNDRP